jgi:diketogulonate reductase-like aldo/keto reductase
MQENRTFDANWSGGRRAVLKSMGAGLAATALSSGITATGGAQPQVSGGIRPGSAQPPMSPVRPSSAIMRKIPSTGEELPAIGLGTFFTFDVLPGQPRDHLRQVIQTYWDGGARVIDTSPLYGSGEISVGAFATALGIADDVFYTDKIWSTGEYLGDESHALCSLRLTKERLWRQRIDVMQVHSLINVEIILPYLRAWKKEGHIRYAGVTHYEDLYLPPLVSWVERGNLDFVQARYSIFNRNAEERLLPAAAERGIAVLTNMPFEKARLFKIVEGRELPGFASDIGATSWAAFFLKWVISHPNVTCALPSTSNPAHAAENVEALRGPLPDREMRARMVRYMEGIPGFGEIDKMPWYPDKHYNGFIAQAQTALRARS